MDATVATTLITVSGAVAVSGFGVLVALINRNNNTTKENTRVTQEAVVVAQTAVTESAVKVEQVRGMVDGHMTEMRQDLKEMSKVVADSAQSLATAMERIHSLRAQLEELSGQPLT